MTATESEPVVEETQDIVIPMAPVKIETPAKRRETKRPDVIVDRVPEPVTVQYIDKPAKPQTEPPKEEPPKPAFVMPEITEGMKVIHKAFGEGTVTRIYKSENKINVKFGAGEKTFVVEPGNKNNAFERGFLKVK